jgi:hypothetical protein
MAVSSRADRTPAVDDAGIPLQAFVALEQCGDTVLPVGLETEAKGEGVVAAAHQTVAVAVACSADLVTGNGLHDGQSVSLGCQLGSRWKWKRS